MKSGSEKKGWKAAAELAERARARAADPYCSADRQLLRDLADALEDLATLPSRIEALVQAARAWRPGRGALRAARTDALRRAIDALDGLGPREP